MEGAICQSNFAHQCTYKNEYLHLEMPPTGLLPVGLLHVMSFYPIKQSIDIVIRTFGIFFQDLVMSSMHRYTVQYSAKICEVFGNLRVKVAGG